MRNVASRKLKIVCNCKCQSPPQIFVMRSESFLLAQLQLLGCLLFCESSHQRLLPETCVVLSCLSLLLWQNRKLNKMETVFLRVTMNSSNCQRKETITVIWAVCVQAVWGKKEILFLQPHPVKNRIESSLVIWEMHKAKMYTEIVALICYS